MKKSKILGIILCVIGLILISFIGYRTFMVTYYKLAKDNTKEYKKIAGLKIKDTITIKTEKVKKKNYLTYENVKIRNDFKDFKVLLDEKNLGSGSLKYALYDEKGNIKAAFWMTKSKPYIDALNNPTQVVGKKDKRIKDGNLKKFIKKNKIKTDIDLLKYLSENKYKKNNIFTKNEDLKERYTFQAIISILFLKVNGATLLNGDYDGYILNTSADAKEVNIIKDNKRYTFTFVKSAYFTDEYINELLNTIVIEKEK